MTVVLGYKYTAKTRDFHWRFPFNKNPGLKFQKFHLPNGTVHSGCTDPSQATARLVIVLVRRIQKSVSWGNDFVKWKRDISVQPTEMSGPVKVDDLQRWSQNIRILVGSNRNGPFHLISNGNFRNFGLNGKRRQLQCIFSSENKNLLRILIF